MSNTIDNLALWRQVEKSDPAFTKRSQLEGRQVTSINAQYLIKLATEQFGPIGQGWGYKIVDERFDQGAPLFLPQGKDQPLLPVGHEITHTILLELWYMDDGQRCTVSQYGHTPYVYAVNQGSRLKTDNEAPKKSLTDAMKKCLSLLGFAADVFLGMHDDHAYVEALAADKAIERADDHQAQAEKEKDKLLEEVKEAVHLLNTAVTLFEAKTHYERTQRMLASRLGSSNAAIREVVPGLQRRITRAKKAADERLTPSETKTDQQQTA